MLQKTSSFPVQPSAPLALTDARIELRWGWGLIAAFLALLLASATFIRLDAAAYAPAVITVSGNRQAVQHREGGTVSKLLVREGQHVRKGQVLLTLRPADIGASEKSAFNQWLALEARRTRLFAERDQLHQIAVPTAFRTLFGSNRLEALRVLSLQQAELTTNRQAISERKRILVQRISQIRQQITGFQGQSRANVRQQSLISEELEGSKRMAVKGWVSQNRIRALERSKAELEGGNSSLVSNVFRAQEQIGELESQLLSCQRRSDFRPARRSEGRPLMLRCDDMQRAPIGALCISSAALLIRAL
jgi:HlyD family secretion protein